MINVLTAIAFSTTGASLTGLAVIVKVVSIDWLLDVPRIVISAVPA
ncbi:MAG: hypothetical protein SAL70_24625 [Scytonema sp. PMC 1070.18]|nr:hypothetical protein [Scytonema sp. PMC 1070.18]